MLEPSRNCAYALNLRAISSRNRMLSVTSGVRSSGLIRAIKRNLRKGLRNASGCRKSFPAAAVVQNVALKFAALWIVAAHRKELGNLARAIRHPVHVDDVLDRFRYLAH